MGVTPVIKDGIESAECGTCEGPVLWMGEVEDFNGEPYYRHVCIKCHREQLLTEVWPRPGRYGKDWGAIAHRRGKYLGGLMQRYARLRKRSENQRKALKSLQAAYNELLRTAKRSFSLNGYDIELIADLVASKLQDPVEETPEQKVEIAVQAAREV